MFKGKILEIFVFGIIILIAGTFLFIDFYQESKQVETKLNGFRIPEKNIEIHQTIKEIYRDKLVREVLGLSYIITGNDSRILIKTQIDTTYKKPDFSESIEIGDEIIKKKQ